MHQEIETENKRRSLITAIIAVVNTLDTVQACILMDKFDGANKEQFTLRGTAYNTSLSGMLRSADCMRPLSEVGIIFEGGPTLHERHKGTVATFVTDRLLRGVREHGLEYVKDAINDVVDWKAKSYEVEKSDEWDDVAAAENYAG